MVKLKDPNQPTRPLSAYFAWMKDNRVKVKDANEGISNKELTSKLGQAWSALTDEEKSPYTTKAKEQLQSWKEQMVEYKKTPEYRDFQAKKAAAKANDTGKGGKKKRKAKPPKDPNQPKRPSTGFFLYVADKREEVKASLPEDQRKKVTLITKRVGEMWKTNEEEKNKYNERAKKLKAEWDEKMAAYKQTQDYRDFQERLKEWKQDQKNKEREARMSQSNRRKKAQPAQRRHFPPSSSSSDTEGSSDESS